MKQKSIRDVCKRVTDSDVTHICSVSSIQQYKGVKIPLSSQMDPGLETAEDEAVLCRDTW